VAMADGDGWADDGWAGDGWCTGPPTATACSRPCMRAWSWVSCEWGCVRWRPLRVAAAGAAGLWIRNSGVCTHCAVHLPLHHPSPQRRSNFRAIELSVTLEGMQAGRLHIQGPGKQQPQQQQQQHVGAASTISSSSLRAVNRTPQVWVWVRLSVACHGSLALPCLSQAPLAVMKALEHPSTPACNTLHTLSNFSSSTADGVRQLNSCQTCMGQHTLRDRIPLHLRPLSLSLSLTHTYTHTHTPTHPHTHTLMVLELARFEEQNPLALSLHCRSCTPRPASWPPRSRAPWQHPWASPSQSP